MSRRGENIRRRKDGRYEGRYADGCKPDGRLKYRSVYGRTYAEVKKKLYEAATGKNISDKGSDSGLLVSKVSDMWLQNKKLYIKKSTYFHYLSVIEKHIDPFFKNIRMAELNDIMIQDFLTELMQERKPKTVRDILTIFNQILKYAQERALCGESTTKMKLPKDNAGTMRIFSLAEQQQLVTFLSRELNLQKLGVLICLYTGMRLGEICGLQWGDIDFTERVIKVRRTIQRVRNEEGSTGFLIDTPKTQKSIRDIPIPEFLAEYLCEYQCDDASVYVLTGSRQFLQPRTYQNRFKSYLRNSNLSDDYCFHALRHTFASRAIELGFDPKTLSEILGHANVSITLNRYVHSSMELKRRNMERFSLTI